MSKEKEKRPPDNPAGHYVTIEEAAVEAGVVERTVWRWKKNGKVHAIYDRLGHTRVSLEDVMACRQESSESPLRSQVMHLQAQITMLSQQMAAQEAALQREIEELRQHHDLGELLVHALNKAQGGGVETSAWNHLATLLESRRSRSSAGGLAAMLAKRGLPLDGTLRLSNFAEDHHIAIHEIKKLYDAGTIGLTVYERPGEHKRNKREWWISKGEQESLIAYWQQQGISYTECPLCPHLAVSKEHAG